MNDALVVLILWWCLQQQQEMSNLRKSLNAMFSNWAANIHWPTGITAVDPMTLQGAAEKSSPLKFFAVFSATVWHFNLKIYRFIY